MSLMMTCRCEVSSEDLLEFHDDGAGGLVLRFYYPGNEFVEVSETWVGLRARESVSLHNFLMAGPSDELRLPAVGGGELLADVIAYDKSLCARRLGFSPKTAVGTTAGVRMVVLANKDRCRLIERLAGLSRLQHSDAPPVFGL